MEFHASSLEFYWDNGNWSTNYEAFQSFSGFSTKISLKAEENVFISLGGIGTKWNVLNVSFAVLKLHVNIKFKPQYLCICYKVMFYIPLWPPDLISQEDYAMFTHGFEYPLTYIPLYTPTGTLAPVQKVGRDTIWFLMLTSALKMLSSLLCIQWGKIA